MFCSRELSPRRKGSDWAGQRRINEDGEGFSLTGSSVSGKMLDLDHG